jgi:hypothetical protein
MNKVLLYIFFSVCVCQSAFGRKDITGQHFLIEKTRLDTCYIPAFSIERSGDLLRIVEPVPAENGLAFQWYRNGDKIANATAKTFQTKEAGYYTLKLISKANLTCTITSTNFIGIYPPDSGTSLWLVVDYTSNKLTTSPTMPGSTLEWYRNNQLITGQNGTSVTYQADGTYQVKERYQQIVKQSNEVVFAGGVAVEIIKGTYFQLGDPCRPGPYLKTDFISDVPVDYQWYFNGAPVKDSTNTHFNPVTTGEYQVSVHIPFRNRTYVSGRYKLVPADFPKSLPITKMEDACGNALLKVDDTFMQKYRFKSIVWRKDGQEIPNEPYPYYKATKSGYYTFSMKYLVDGKSEECTYNSFIEFTKKPDTDLNVGYAYAGSGCVVDSFKVFVDDNKNYTYAWVRNDTVLKNQTSHELFIKDKGVYKAFINKGDGCMRETNPVTLKGCTPDSLNRFLLLNPPLITADKTTVLVDEQSFIRANGCTNVNFQWLKDTEPIAGATGASLEVKQSGLYRLQIEKLGCTAISETIRIVVENILSAEPEPDTQIKVFPNPFDKTIDIELPTSVNKNIEVKLTNTTGKLIKHWEIGSNHKLDLSEIPAGVYLLSFEVGGKLVVRKIVKGH